MSSSCSTLSFDKPSRELDAWIAENVMGWRRVEEGNCYFWPTKEMVDQIKEAYPDVLGITYFPAPAFSSDISAAWEVVAHFCFPRYCVCLRRTGTGDWQFDIELNGWDGPIVSAIHESECLAICEAAHKALCKEQAMTGNTGCRT